ncbi:MAG: YraN family protein [Beutenbergiaceae bacterium]
MRANEVGRTGERDAAGWLRRSGMEILDTNWRCRYGELDIVARDRDTLVFVEVKTRTSTAYGHPAEAVTGVKLARLRRLATAWLQQHSQHASAIRIDVIAVLSPAGQDPMIEHLRGVG